MADPRVAIVVLNFNGLTDTKKNLHSLLKTSYSNFKIYLVDNGSKQDETKILATEFENKRIVYIRFSKNFGFTGGNNKIIKKLKEKYIVFLNNDTEVERNWLTHLVNLLEKDKSIAVAQPKILWLKNKKYFDYAGACGGFIDIFGYPFTRGRIFATRERDHGQYNNVKEIFWASGTAMIVRRSVFKKVGFLDESFFNYMEEIDLCFRIQRAGYKIVCNSDSVVFHKVAATASRNMFLKRYWEHRNNLLLILKNYPLGKLIYVFPIRLILEYISFFYYLSQKQTIYSLAVIKSQISLIQMILSLLLKKNRGSRFETKKMKKLIYPKSIVLDYFIFKKRRFYEL